MAATPVIACSGNHFVHLSDCRLREPNLKSFETSHISKMFFSAEQENSIRTSINLNRQSKAETVVSLFRMPFSIK
jgi:hypothetical protein